MKSKRKYTPIDLAFRKTMHQRARMKKVKNKDYDTTQKQVPLKELIKKCD